METAEFDLHAALEDDHWWFRARREIVFHQLQRYLPPGIEHRVLEVGCGTGGNLRFLADHYRVMAVELDAYAASLAAQRSGCDIRCGTLPDAMANVGFKPDAVLMLDVLEHVADDFALVDRATDQLSDGGLLVLTVPADPRLWSNHDVALGHFRRYSRTTFSALWRDKPLEPLLVANFNSFLYPFIRLARSLRPARAGETDLKAPNPYVNALLYAVFAAERNILGRWSLPWGCSLMAILRRRVLSG